MRRIIILGVCLLFFIPYLTAQKVVRVPRNLSDGDTVYYLTGQNLYHAKDCPELIGKIGFATNIWTMRWRHLEPCPKCLYKEISVSKTPIIFPGKSIISWKGSAQKNTETFSIYTDEWIINWETNGDSNFAITVYNADTNDMVELVANIIGSGKDNSVIRGKGRYYLKIMTSQPYTIEVQEKK